jgi:aarF domain-containing kinase
MGVQVYKATLKQDVLPPSYQDPKRKQKFHPAALALPHPPSSVPTAVVAMKVLHPRVEKMISCDLAIMGFFAGLISLLPGMEWLSLREEAEVFGRMMYEQLDLRNEAENLDLFEKNFAHRRLPISFPRPLKTWSTKDILIEEYQTALPLELFLKNGGGPYDRQLAEIGLDAFLVRPIFFHYRRNSLPKRICSSWITLFMLTYIPEISWSNCPNL